MFTPEVGLLRRGAGGYLERAPPARPRPSAATGSTPAGRKRSLTRQHKDLRQPPE